MWQFNMKRMQWPEMEIISDESEPSWLEPELELKDFQLGSWPFSLQLEIENRPKRAEIFNFLIFFSFM